MHTYADFVLPRLCVAGKRNDVHMSNDKEILEGLAEKEYEHGFVTDVEQEFIPKGINEDVIRLISSKKDEPQWLLDFRLDAFRTINYKFRRAAKYTSSIF